jgi:hypothetical protein
MMENVIDMAAARERKQQAAETQQADTAIATQRTARQQAERVRANKAVLRSFRIKN